MSKIEACIETIYKAVPAGTAAMGGYELANNQPVVGCVLLATSAGFVVENVRQDKKEREQAFRLGGRIGSMAMVETIMREFERPTDTVIAPEDGIFYRSLDGKTEIDDFDTLLMSTGTSPQNTAERIGIILGHSKKRTLTIGEVESLRRADAVLKAAPALQTDILCDKGKEIAAELQNTVLQYEEDYRRKNGN